MARKRGVERGTRARVVYLRARHLGPFDLATLLLLPDGVVGRALHGLDRLRVAPRCDHVDRLAHCGDAFGEHEPLVKAVDRVVGLNGSLPREKDGARVEPVVGEEDGEPALLVAFHERPVDGRRAAVARQQ